MSLDQAEKEYLKYLQQKHKEGRKSRAKKEEPEAGLIPAAAAVDLVTPCILGGEAATPEDATPSVDSEAEVITQVATNKRGRKPKKSTVLGGEAALPQAL